MTTMEIPFGEPVAETTPEAALDQDAEFLGITEGTRPAAWKMAIYGKPGVGKSTLGTRARAPLFLDLENGLARVDCVKTKHLKYLQNVLDALDYVIKSPKFQTAVIDTIDEVENMLSKKVVYEHNKVNNVKVKAVDEIAWGRGGALLAAEWKSFIDKLTEVTDAGKNVLLIGHQQVIKFQNPADADYDFFTINVHKKSEGLVTAKLDAILFARFETLVKTSGDDDKGKARATGRRILQTNEGSSWVAKNRFGLPNTIPFDDFTFDSFN